MCILTTGFDYECDENTGGIKPGTLLIAQWENIEDWDEDADGEITSITQASGTFFYRYKIKKEIVDFVDTENHNPLEGSLHYENVINAMVNNMSKEKNREFRILAQKPLVLIMQDLNDVYHGFGFESGAEKVGGTNSAQSGKEYGTHNGYTFGFTDKSVKIHTVAPAVIATLDIDGVVIT